MRCHHVKQNAGLAVALAVGAFFLATCAHQAPRSAEGPKGTSASASASTFARFVDEYFDAKFDFEPSSGTGAGLHQYDGRLEDRSAARIAARIVELARFRVRLAAMDHAKMAFDDVIDAEALLGQVQAELLDLQTLKVWQTNPMLYAGLAGGAIDGLMKRDFAPAQERLRAVIARLSAMPALYAAGRANLDNPPKEFTDLALRMSQGSEGFFAGAVATWAKDAAGPDAALLARFTRENAAALVALRDFTGWLQTYLVAHSHGAYAIGAENFLAKLRHEDMVDLPLPDLLARGEAQLARDQAAFVATAKQVDPTRKAAQVIGLLSAVHPSADDLIASIARSVDDARRFLVQKDLVTIPSDVRPRIEETPPYARSGSFASMDTPGPYETRATEAFYYVTPVEKDWTAQHKEEHLRLYNRFVVADINVHEAYPGHYLQFLYAPRFPTKTRKLVAASSNAEGWAHYAEQMMIDQGFGGPDPKIASQMRLAQLQEALLRDCRYVVGIKLHTGGMTVEEGAKVFEEQAYEEPANAYEEARRGAYNPTYLYYTLGKLLISELAADFRAKTGASLKQFHDAFVSQGSLPIPLVRRLLLARTGATGYGP